MSDQPRNSLDALQRWMQAVILHPGGIVAGARSAEACAQIDTSSIEIGAVVTRSRALTAVERLEIYHHSYFARLLECLREEYSVLAAAVGEELFDAFAVGYLQRYPSRSYTLADLGDRFPEYLNETRPAGESTIDVDADWPEFLIDLARLERTVNDVFDGPGAEGGDLLDHARLAAIPPERWPAARLECVPCLTLLALTYPVNDYFTAVRRGERPEIPDRVERGFIAVTRHDFRVYRYPLVAAQYELLGALLSGEAVGTAIARGAAASTMPDRQFAAALHDWFFRWTVDGFFRDVRV